MTLQESLAWKELICESQNKLLGVCPSPCFLPVMHSKNYFLCAPYASLPEEESFHSLSFSSLKSLDVQKIFVSSSSIEEKTKKLYYFLSHHMNCLCFLTDTKEDFDYQYTSQVLLSQIRAILSHIPKPFYQNITFVYWPTWVKEEPLEVSFLENLFYFLKTELTRDQNYSFPFWYGGVIPSCKVSAYLQSSYLDGLVLEIKKKEDLSFLKEEK